MANRLAASTSPYLLQHAGNPVDWYPWGEEAFARARELDRPVLLSIGYSACHWCHVMAHESFESPAVAAAMNRDFVNVKVDREERPDVDAVYMDAVQAMTGHGGWPLTVFLTPGAEPFYGGTYFPPVARHGMPGFLDLLGAIAGAWRAQRDDVLRGTQTLLDALQRSATLALAEDAVGCAGIADAAARVAASFDPREGGFGGAPKFPQAPLLGFLLGRAARSRDRELLDAVTVTLGAMARGGIRDHLGGGFHRYSVDDRWMVPHFEKMLYDNAQLARVYVEAWQLTGIAAFRAVAEETLDYVLRELTTAEGAFCAAQDADTPAGEGAYFVWTPGEVAAALDPDVADAARAWFGITAGGNFEGGATVLGTRRRAAAVAAELGIDERELAARVSLARVGLGHARSRRTAPATDTKVLADWNGLAIDAFARAGTALGRPDYVAAAIRAARAVLSVAGPAGDLAHSWKDARRGAPGFAEDYGAMAGACISLYEATHATAWLAVAAELVETAVALFADPDGGFYRIGARHEALVVRQMAWVDGAMPSGNALLADALWRLGSLTATERHLTLAETTVQRGWALARRAPASLGALLAVADTLADGPREIAVIGSPDQGASALLDVVRAYYLPGTVVAGPARVDAADADARPAPMLAHLTPVGGRAAAYVCRRRVCQLPVTEVAALEVQIAATWPLARSARIWSDEAPAG